MLKDLIENLVKDSISASLEAGELGELKEVPDSVPVDFTKSPEHGDRAISIAMKLTKEAKLPPRKIAEAIVSKLEDKFFSNIEIAGPGFINLTLDWNMLEDSLANIHKQGENYGHCSSAERPDKSFSNALIEFVSANPTGDLHLGHGRQAVLGSAMANLLETAGYQVSTEFYINDAGAQIEKLTNSAKQTLAIDKGEINSTNYDEENNYPLAAMQEILPELKSQIQDGNCPGDIAKKIFLEQQKEILAEAKTEFNIWYSELENLHQQDTNGKTKVDQVCDFLLEKGLAYEEEGALWFKAKDFGDERNRVLRKSTGNYTYLAADLAYHQDKIARGHDKLINLWGADHHGQIPGITGALTALGEPAERLEIILMQLVSLQKAGEEVRMSKRTGNFVTVKELIEEVGVDAFRYFLVESQANNRIIFDLELATKQDKDNPVYYIQYAHARCCSILRSLTGTQFDTEDADPIISEEELSKWLEEFQNNQGLLSNSCASLEAEALQSTKALLLALANFPEEIKDAAFNKAPYKIANYLKNIAGLFHQFYTHNRVICNDQDLMKARTSIVAATKTTLANALKILAIEAQTKM